MNFLFLALFLFSGVAFGYLTPTGTNATQLQGVNISSSSPTNLDCLIYSSGSASWGPSSCGGGGSGTVTSVGVRTDTSTSSIFANSTNNITGSPVTTSGNMTLTLSTQVKNKVLAGPTTGSDAAPAFRLLVGADLPLPAAATLGGVFSKAAVSNNFLTSISSVDGSVGQAQPAFTNISGSLAGSQLPTFTGDVTNSSAAMTVAKIQTTTVSGTTGTGNVVFSAAPTLTGTSTIDTIVSANGIAVSNGTTPGGAITMNVGASNNPFGMGYGGSSGTAQVFGWNFNNTGGHYHSFESTTGFDEIDVVADGVVDFKFGLSNTRGSFYLAKSSGANVLWTTEGAGSIGANGASRPLNVNAVGAMSVGSETVTYVNGDSKTVGNNLGVHIIHIAAGGTIAAATVTLPATPLAGQQLTLTTDGVITVLTVTPNSGQTLIPTITTITKSVPVRLYYNVADTSWYAN